MDAKEKYKVFCENEKELPVFLQYWWLNVVCEETSWNVSIIEKNNTIVAALPYYFYKDRITMPKLTQFMGPYIKYPMSIEYFKKLALEKELITELLSKLPHHSSFLQQLSPCLSNWLPFFWKGYQQTTRYSYVIRSNKENAHKPLYQKNRSRRLKKAAELNICVKESTDIEQFIDLNLKTFARKNLRLPYSVSLVREVYKVAANHNATKLLFAYDSDANCIAGCLLLYDAMNCYYLMGGILEEKKHLGGMDLVLNSAINFSINTNRNFDFEGSMIESIEEYFRSFGAIQQPYFKITKANSLFEKLKEMLRILR